MRRVTPYCHGCVSRDTLVVGHVYHARADSEWIGSRVARGAWYGGGRVITAGKKYREKIAGHHLYNPARIGIINTRERDYTEGNGLYIIIIELLEQNYHILLTCSLYFNV